MEELRLRFDEHTEILFHWPLDFLPRSLTEGLGLCLSLSDEVVGLGGVEEYDKAGQGDGYVVLQYFGLCNH